MILKIQKIFTFTSTLIWYNIRMVLFIIIIMEVKTILLMEFICYSD